MTPLVAGIDLSTRALHAALIPLDPDASSDEFVVFRSADLPVMPKSGATPQYRTVARCRAIRDAVLAITTDVPTAIGSGWHRGIYDIVNAWVEEPTGHRNSLTQNVLRELYGAIVACVPSSITVAAITPHQWRAVHRLEHRYAKEVGIGYAAGWCMDANTRPPLDEHAAEALLIALAGRTLTWQAAA